MATEEQLEHQLDVGDSFIAARNHHHCRAGYFYRGRAVRDRDFVECDMFAFNLCGHVRGDMHLQALQLLTAPKESEGWRLLHRCRFCRLTRRRSYRRSWFDWHLIILADDGHGMDRGRSREWERLNDALGPLCARAVGSPNIGATIA